MHVALVTLKQHWRMKTKSITVQSISTCQLINGFFLLNNERYFIREEVAKTNFIFVLDVDNRLLLHASCNHNSFVFTTRRKSNRALRGTEIECAAVCQTWLTFLGRQSISSSDT
jgi:hypothetical protein